ncbi:MAG: N-acetylneuraminic acid mutarotase [Sphingobacteriales bacterium]
MIMNILVNIISKHISLILKLVFVLTFSFIFGSLNAQENLSIGNNSVDPSAIIDLKSDSLGFLPPRLTTVEREQIDNPANGLVVYNLDSKCLNVFDDIKGWQSLCGCHAKAGEISITETWLCIGGALEITLTGSRGIITWQHSLDGVIYTNIPKENDTYLRIRNIGDTTFYRAILTDGSCDPDTSDVVKIDVEFIPPLPPAEILGPDSFCTNQVAWLHFDAIPEVTSYFWTITGGAIINSGQGTDSINVIFGTEDALVCVQSKNACLGPPNCVTFRHTDLEAPKAISGLFTYCSPINNVVYKVGPTKDAASFQWKIIGNNGTEIITFAADSAILNLPANGSDSICVRSINCLDTSIWYCKNIVHGDIWTKKTDFPGLARDGSYDFEINGIIYVGGGGVPNSVPFSDFYAYNPMTDTWTKKADAPSTLTRTGSFAVNGKGYVVCGSTTSTNTVGGYSNLVLEYDPVNDTWTQKFPFLGAPRSEGSAFVLNDTAYFGAGRGGTNTIDFWRYDQPNDTWTEVAPIPKSTKGGGAVLNGKGYIVDPFTAQQYLMAYDPIANSWATPNNYPGTPWEGVTCFATGDYLFAIGGYTSSSTLYRNVYQYDDVTNFWTQLNLAPYKNAYSAAGVVGDKVYFGLGGSKNWYEYCPPHK